LTRGSTQLLLAVGAVLAGAAAAWLIAGGGRPSGVPEPAAPALAPRETPAPATAASAPPAREVPAAPPASGPPREGLFAPGESLPTTMPEPGPGYRVRSRAAPPENPNHAPGGLLIDAMLATGAVWIRYKDATVRDRVRGATVTVPPTLWSIPNTPPEMGGIALSQAVDAFRTAGVTLRVVAPVVYFDDAPEPSEAGPR
jgi:hypothetical protein